MASIKKFFEKRKAEAKFKVAGPGRRLNETSPPQPTNVSATKIKRVPGQTSEGAQRAAEAALARLEKQPKTTIVKSKVLRQQIRDELNKDQSLAELIPTSSSGSKESLASEPVGIYFTCSLIGDDILPKKEIESKIKSFLYLQLAEEPLITSSLMIYTFTKDKNKVNACIETLHKYLDNLISNPLEEKFRKIRINNKVFQERVLILEGSAEFMEAVGFEKQLLFHETGDEYFYVISEDTDTDHLMTAVDVLTSAEPILPELARNIQVFRPSQTLPQIKLSDDFYNLTAEEIKRQQKIKTETVEKNSQLRTKAMREKDELRQRHQYRYAQLRIRLPDGYILQGTFRATDFFAEVRSFIAENLAVNWIPFTLNSPTGNSLTNDEMTIEELNLAPSAYITFVLDPDIQKDIASELRSHKINHFLKPEVMDLASFL